MAVADISLNSKILVVDDDPINIRNAVRILKDEYRVSYATSGKDALELIKKDQPDLILLDLHMPQMNGFEVIRILKANEKTEDIPVIFLTADSDQETEAKGLNEGALDFIAKPFMDEIVKQRVKHLIELSILQKDLKSEVERQTKYAEERRKQMEEMSFQTVQALAGAIDAKDKYTKGHSSRVSDYSVMLARKLGWNSEDIDNLRYAALLHDVGKIGVPDSVLNKPGRLSENEFNVIKSHSSIGGEILRNITTVVDAVDVARHHHERYDGSGYPDGLKGEEIPRMARVVSIADSFDAMNSRRLYRMALPWKVIRDELVKGSGSQFDPDYLKVFLEMFDGGELNEKETIIEQSVNENANIIKRLFESAYDSGISHQVDELTGLLLRGGAEPKINEALKQGPGIFAIIDLDNLKKLNDLYGHKMGDELLKSLGKILIEEKKIDIASRLGGDEFVIFVKQDSGKDIKKILEDIYLKFDEVKSSNECFEYNSLSCGICTTVTTDSYEDVYANADKALYFAKRNGKGNFHYFERESDTAPVHTSVDLDALVKSFETAGDYSGAMQVELREFGQLFEYVKNMKKRYSHDIQLVMITLNATENSAPNIDKISQAIDAMKEAVCNTIRTVDICTRYTSMQFLVILFGTGKSEVDLIMERIFSTYYKTCSNNKIIPTYQTSTMD